MLFAFTKYVNPNYSLASLQGTATSVLPLALAAVAQAIVVISGGIDLSISSQMALTSCHRGHADEGDPSDEFGRRDRGRRDARSGSLLGAVNGGLDRPHAGARHRRDPGDVVRLGRLRAARVDQSPGGAAADWLKALVVGSAGASSALPKAAVVLVVIVAVIWIPLRRSRLGLSIYAIGSNQLAAFRSGVPVNRTKIVAYAWPGLFAAFAGLSLTASTGIGSPVPGPTYVARSASPRSCSAASASRAASAASSARSWRSSSFS